MAQPHHQQEIGFEAEKKEVSSNVVMDDNVSLPPLAEEASDQDDGLLYGWRYYSVMFSLFFALLLGAMDGSIVATALVTIGAQFDDFVRIQWVVLAYLLTDLGFALIFARLSDVIGRKSASILAVAILTIGSLGAGLATSMDMLIIFRAIQGVGGAGVYSLPLTVLPEITPANKFGLMSAASGLVFTCSSILGPTIGGVITTHASWRWCFLFNVPCGVVAMLIMLATWPKMETVGKISWSQLDWPGALLIIASSVLTVFALQEAGSDTYAWSSPVIIGCLVGGILATIAFGVWIYLVSNRKWGIEPLFPIRILKNRVLVGAFIVATTSGWTLFTVLIELSERLQIVNGRTAAQAGIDLLPFTGAAAFGSALAGFVSAGRRNLSVETLLICSALAVIGCGLLAYVKVSPGVPSAMYGYQVVLGLGQGGMIVAGTIAIKLSAEKTDAASSQGLQAQNRLFGANVGLALATIVLDAQLNSDLSGVLSPSQLSDLKRSLNSISQLSPSQVAAVGRSFADAFRVQLLVCLGVSAIGFFCCMPMWQRNPRTFKNFRD